MNTPSSDLELVFARKVRRVLDDSAAQTPRDALERLAAARRTALARKKAEPVLRHVLAPAYAGMGSHAPSRPQRRAGLRRLRLVWPVLALVAALAGIAYRENEVRLAEVADIDAAMLSDSLPLSAYLDHGFHAYLSRAE
jgi:hypothetical protein